MFLNLLKIIIISIFIIIISHIFYYYIYNKLIEPPISPDIEHIRQQYEKLVANLSTITPISPPEYSTLNHMNNNNYINNDNSVNDNNSGNSVNNNNSGNSVNNNNSINNNNSVNNNNSGNSVNNDNNDNNNSVNKSLQPWWNNITHTQLQPINEKDLPLSKQKAKNSKYSALITLGIKEPEPETDNEQPLLHDIQKINSTNFIQNQIESEIKIPNFAISLDIPKINIANEQIEDYTTRQYDTHPNSKILQLSQPSQLSHPQQPQQPQQPYNNISLNITENITDIP